MFWGLGSVCRRDNIPSGLPMLMQASSPLNPKYRTQEDAGGGSRVIWAEG